MELQNRDQQQLESLQLSARELDDQLFQRRRARWLVYGRAILTIATLGLLTVVLYNITHTKAQSHDDEQRARLVFGGNSNIDARQPPSQSVSYQEARTVATLSHGESHRSKRNVPKIVVNSRSSSEARGGLKDENDIQLDSDDEIRHVEKLQRRVVNQAHHNSHRHRHSDGYTYYLKGYKCVPVPVTKSSSSSRRNRPRLPGMFT